MIDHILNKISEITQERNIFIEPNLICGSLLTFKVKSENYFDEVTLVIRKDYDDSVIVDLFSNGDFEWRL